MKYRVVIASGHAKDWSYETAVMPDEVIHVAPSIGEAHGPWVRVPADTDPPWPGQKRYRLRGPHALDGTVVVLAYHMEPDQRVRRDPPPGPRPGVSR